MSVRNRSLLLVAALAFTVVACKREPPPAASTPSAKHGEVLLTAAVDPVSGQTVTLPDRISIRFPAGAVRSRQTLTIKSAPEAPPSESDALEPLDTLDLSLGEAHEFDQEITIEMPFEPGKIPPDIRPESGILVAFLDSGSGRWVHVPVEVDLNRRIAIVRTRHLSVWRSYYLKRGYDILGSRHFLIVFDRSMSVPKPTWPSTRDFISEIEAALVNAWDQYSKAGFKMPSSPMHVFVEARYQEPEWGKYSGHIYMGSPNGKAEVRQDLAHELFHAVQNRYYSIQGMGLRFWWIEATAEYAADAVANGGAGQMLVPAYDYFSTALNDSDRQHAYATSHFIRYLVDRGVSFKTMWDDVAAGNLPDVIGPLETAVQKATQHPMDTHFRNFARYLFFDPKTPLKSLRGLYYDATSARVEIAVDQDQVANTFTLAKHYTAQMWGIRARFSSLKPGRYFVAMLEGAPPSRGDIEVYLEKKNRAPSAILLPIDALSPSSPVFASLSDGDTLFVLATNPGDAEQTVRVKLLEMVLSVTPSTVQAGIGQEVGYTVTVTNAPEGIARLRYDWDFGDGSTATCRYERVPVEQKHTFTKEGSRRITVSLRVGDAPQVLTQGSVSVDVRPADGLRTREEYYDKDPGRPYLIYTYRVDADQAEILHGRYRRWHKNGVLELEEHYKDGRKNGASKSWHSNGKPREEMTFVDDVIDGTVTSWAENGGLTLQATYKMGLLHGPYTTYYSRWGEIQSQGTYKEDRQDGPWITTVYWQRDGRLLYYEVVYKDGTQISEGSKFLYEKQVEKK